MVRAERVLEARVGGAGVDEVREPELPHVSQPLENGRVDELQGQRVDTNVVPQRIPDDHDGAGTPRARQAFGPASAIAGAMLLPNFSKFLRNISASFFAWAS